MMLHKIVESELSYVSISLNGLVTKLSVSISRRLVYWFPILMTLVGLTLTVGLAR